MKQDLSAKDDDSFSLGKIKVSIYIMNFLFYNNDCTVGHSTEEYSSGSSIFSPCCSNSGIPLLIEEEDL